jgi:hypothetical protein
MDIGAILFFFIAGIIAIFSLRPILINIKVGRYLKKYHHAFWAKYIRTPSGIFGMTPFQAIKSLGGLDDPKIAGYEKEWNKAMRQFFLLFLALIIISLLFFFIAFFLYKAKVI